MATERGRKTRPTLKVGICGEHGGEPSSVEFCYRIGLNYVSCSPFRVLTARLAAAQAAAADKLKVEGGRTEVDLLISDRGGPTLALTFRNHRELHAERVQHRIDGFKARMCACAQRLVQALPTEPCLFGNLRHASRFGHIAERGDEYLGVWVCGSRRKISAITASLSRYSAASNGLYVVFFFLMVTVPLQGLSFLSTRAILFALAMSLVCEPFGPPANRT